MGRRKEPTGKLTPQQTYLLHRIPSTYQMNGVEELPEPPEVKKARRLIDKWDKEKATLQCRAKKRTR